MLRRRMMIADVGKMLPSGYKLCEYLESTGTQWIDTFVEIDSSFKCDLCMEIRERNRTGSSMLNIFGNAGRFGANVNGIDNEIYLTWNLGIGERKYFHVIVDFSDELLSVNSREISISEFLPLKNDNTTFGIFKRSDNDYRDGISKVFYFKGSNQTKSFDFIPALDATGTPCMYDIISGNTFYNMGNGEFLYKLA